MKDTQRRDWGRKDVAEVLERDRMLIAVLVFEEMDDVTRVTNQDSFKI